MTGSRATAEGSSRRVLDLLQEALQNQARERAEKYQKVAAFIKDLAGRASIREDGENWGEVAEVLKLLED